jgi:HK97 family phage portal protein
LDYGGEEQVTDPYEQSIAVFRAVNVVGDALARAPVKLFRGEEEVTSGKIFDLFQRPNAFMRQSTFAKVVVSHQLLNGNAYIYLDEPDSLGVPRSLLPLPPNTVSPIRSKGNAYELRGWTYTGTGTDTVVIPPERIIQLQYAPSPNDPLSGTSPMDVASISVESDHLASVWNKAVLQNSGSPAGILKWAGEGRFDEADARLVKDQWVETYGGANKAESIAVLGSNFDWQTIGVSPKDMQWLEARKWNLGDIARAFNVPLVFLNEYESSGLSDAGLKIQAKLLYTNNVIPMAVTFGQMLTEWVVRPHDPSLVAVFDFDAVEALREDLTEKLEHAKRLSDLGFPLNAINQKLELGMDPVEWGETHLVNAGLIPVSDLISYSSSMAIEGPTEDEPGEAPAETVATEAEAVNFTGVQMTTAVDIVGKVALGELPYDSAIGLLMTLFGFTEEQAQAMVGSAVPPPVVEEVVEEVVEAGARATVSLPEFIQDNARRGLEYHAQGLSGDGVRPHTIREANQLAAGKATEDKLRRMSAWFARHLSDLDTEKNSDPNHDDYPGAGAVAWLLWGGNPTSDPMRAKEWVDRTLAVEEEATARLRHDSRGLVTQSLVISRGAYDAEDVARQFVLASGFDDGAMDSTDITWRFRQAKPEAFIQGSLRAQRLSDGVIAIKGRLASDYQGPDGTWVLPAWQERQIEKIHDRFRRPYERKLQSKVSRVFYEIRTDMIRALEDQAVPEVVQVDGRSLKRDPLDAEITEAGIQMVLDALDPQAQPDKFKAIVQDSIGAGVDTSIFKAKEYGVEYDEAQLNEAKSRTPKLADNYWERSLGRWVPIFQLTKDKVRDTLLEGLSLGENLNDSMERVRGVFRNGNHGLGVSRARTIARTEVGIASSLAETETYKTLGVKRVEWLSAGDSSVRETHQRANGKIREVGKKFPNGLTRPLDPSGDAAEVINCRCDLIPVVDSVL